MTWRDLALDHPLRVEFEERAAIMEFDGGLTRDVAEREAWRLVRGRGLYGRLWDDAEDLGGE